MVVKKTCNKETCSKERHRQKSSKALRRRSGKSQILQGTDDERARDVQPRHEDGEHIWDDGKISKKTKKLIAIAIAAALRDQHAVRAQLMGAANLGVTKAEVEEALRVTFLLSGMPAYVYGKAQLDEVMKK